jgi:hypothetical protein
MKRTTRNLVLIVILALSVAFLPSCIVPPFSDLQSAKLVGKGRAEVTPSYSSVSYAEDGESGHVQNHYGIQAGYGVAGFMDFRLRYERIQLVTEGSESSGLNVLGFGPKFSLVKNWLAIFLPVGFAFGEDIQASETWQFHPTVLFTVPFNKNIELNTSAKALVPLQGGQNTLVAFNLGFGISSDLDKWAIRPEIGFLFDPGEKGHYMHLSIGFNYRFK